MNAKFEIHLEDDWEIQFWLDDEPLVWLRQFNDEKGELFDNVVPELLGSGMLYLKILDTSDPLPQDDPRYHIIRAYVRLTQ